MAINPRFNAHRNLTKAIQTLQGICAGLIADNHLNNAEIDFLLVWMNDNRAAAETFPGNVIHQRVQHILKDGVITEAERADLLATLKDLTGTEFLETGSSEAAPTVFPVDTLAVVTMPGKSFCLTGRFVTGPRSACERRIIQNGGTTTDTVTLATDYLVIGTLSSPDWLYANHGLKIRKAVEWRSAGRGPCIVAEGQWVSALEKINTELSHEN